MEKHNIYYTRLATCLQNYSNYNSTSTFLSDEHQFALRCWYRKDMRITTGWISYWFTLLKTDREKFKEKIKIMPVVSSYKDIIILLDSILRTYTYKNDIEIQNLICSVIMNNLYIDILNGTRMSEVAKYMPIKNGKMTYAYNALLKYSKQTQKQWRDMIVYLRSDCMIKKQYEENSYPTYAYLYKDCKHCSLKYIYAPNKLSLSVSQLTITLTGEHSKIPQILKQYNANPCLKTIIDILLSDYL